MLNHTPNRITSLLDEIPQQLPVRSPAQQRASRANGSKSRGPVTTAGKSRSALNAVRHGLLASRMMPPTDPRGDDRAYLQIRSELMAQFRPVSFTNTLQVDSMAADCLQLARVRAMIESLQTPRGLKKDDLEAYDRLICERRLLPAVDRVRSNITQGRPPGCKPAEADHLATEILRYMEYVEEEQATQETDHNDPSPMFPGISPRPTPQLQPDEEAAYAEDRRRLQELAAAIEPVKAKLLDHAMVVGLLTSGKRIAKAEQRALVTLLPKIASKLARALEEGEILEARLQRECDASVALVAMAPQQLMLLDRYRARIENTIQRKLSQLREG